MFVQQQNEHFVLTAKPQQPPPPPPHHHPPPLQDFVYNPLPQQPQTTLLLTMQPYIKFIAHAHRDTDTHTYIYIYSYDGSKVSPSRRVLNSTQTGSWRRIHGGSLQAAHTKTEPRRFHLPPPHCCWSCWPRMLHWGWESAAESPGPWSVGCSLGGQRWRRGGEGKGGEEDVGRCAVEIVSVTGEKMPSQTLIQQQQQQQRHLTPEPRRCSLSVLLRASSAVTGVLMSGKSWEFSSVCIEPAAAADSEISSLVRRQTNKTRCRLQAGQKWHAALPLACDWLA